MVMNLFRQAASWSTVAQGPHSPIRPLPDRTQDVRSRVVYPSQTLFLSSLPPPPCSLCDISTLSSSPLFSPLLLVPPFPSYRPAFRRFNPFVTDNCNCPPGHLSTTEA
eukprot:755868-Hanusia_phi.AAC.1